MEIDLFYDDNRQLRLPRSFRAYLDCLSPDYQAVPMLDKLSELAYLTDNGYDLSTAIREYKRTADLFDQETLSDTLVYYITYLRYGVSSDVTSNLLNKLTEKEIIDLFIEELRLRYRPDILGLKGVKWDNDKLKAEAGGDTRMYTKLVTTAIYSKKLLENRKV